MPGILNRTGGARAALILTLACGATPAGAQAADQHYEGVAYTKNGGSLIYREEHWIYREQGVVKRLVLYRCPSGAPFARKQVTATASPYAPDFDFIDGRDGYRESVRSRDGQREVTVRANAQAPGKTVRVTPPAGAVIDTGFDDYVRGHWAQLGEQQDTTISFLVPSRFEFMDIKLRGVAGAQEQGEAVRRLRMSLDAWFGFIAPTIDLTYTAADPRLRRFQGVGNIRDEAGKTRAVRIEFPANRIFAPPLAPEIAAAASMPLTPRCP
jgi:hypothetical protein